MPTPNLKFPTISPSMSADVPRDVNALAEAVDSVVSQHIKTKASTSREGHVQLNDTLTSTDDNQAATASAVKRVNDKFLIQQINAVLEGGWVNFANENAQPLTFYKDGFGVVHLYGNVMKLDTRSLVTVLPEGYRPTGIREYLVQNGANLTRPLYIFPDGKIQSYFNDKDTNIIINVSYPTI